MSSDLDSLLASMVAISHAMQEAFDPRRFLAEFSSHIQGLLPHDRLMVAYREEGGSLSVFAEHAIQGPAIHEGRYTIAFDPGGRYSPDDLAVDAVLAGEPMRVADFGRDPSSTPSGPDARRARAIGVRSRVAVPLRSGGRILGALLAGSFTPAIYTETHVATAQHVADLIAPFIENIVLLHREQRRRSRLASLAGLGRVFGTSLNLRQSFEQVADAVRPVLDFDGMGARLLGESGRYLELVGRVSDHPDSASPTQIPVDSLSFLAKVEAGNPVLIRDTQVELDPTRPGDRRVLEHGTRSCLSVPLWFGEEVGGVLFFGKRQPDWYDGSDVEVASAIAAQIVVALQHQHLAEEQQQRARVEGHARQLEERLTTLRHALGDPYGFDRIIGRSPALRETLVRGTKVAPTETTVLLTGESGTGKELVARAIHYASRRADGPLVAINCAALPETLVESELFGHERGAFTGADKQKRGRFELAAGGTLFLDEVGDLSLAAQAKLLRAVEDHEFQRGGGTATLRADIRLITASNRDLAQASAEGKFREDLFYRLNVFSIHLPPLRERGEDILLLANHFVRDLGPRIGRGEPGLSRDARALLLAYRWPGNIRELENAVERALIISEGELLTAAHFGLSVSSGGPDDGLAFVLASSAAESGLADVERQTILAALEHTRGNKAQAATALGITRTKLYTRLRQLGLRG